MKNEPEIKRRKSIRLKFFDYSSPGPYFITICTHNREPTLGLIENGEVSLSKWGGVVKSTWERIPHHHSQVTLDAFFIMPNHVHGILWFTNGEKDLTGNPQNFEQSKFGEISSKSLPAVIRSFKSAVTREVNFLRNLSAGIFWQRNYYEHIVRNEEDLFNIQKYIEENPKKWELDQYYSQN